MNDSSMDPFFPATRHKEGEKNQGALLVNTIMKKPQPEKQIPSDFQLQASLFQHPFGDPRLEPDPLREEPRPFKSVASPYNASATIDRDEAISNNVDFPEGDSPKLSFMERCRDSRRDTLNNKRMGEYQPSTPSKRYKDETVNGGTFSDHHDALWYDQFQKLMRFKEEFGHCDIPLKFSQDKSLARWVKRQRYQYKRKLEGKASPIKPGRIQMLESIGFVWNAHTAAWEDKFNQLASYQRIRGDCYIPSDDTTHAQLLTWVKCQRRQYRLFMAGKPSNMTQARIDALTAMKGFKWTILK